MTWPTEPDRVVNWYAPPHAPPGHEYGIDRRDWAWLRILGADGTHAYRCLGCPTEHWDPSDHIPRSGVDFDDPETRDPDRDLL